MEKNTSWRDRSSAGSRGTGRVGSGRLGAIPRVVDVDSSSSYRWRGGTPSSTSNAFQRGSGQRAPRPTQHFVTQRQQTNHQKLNFEILVKLANDNVEPSEIIRCFLNPENDLPSFVMENLGNAEYLELILVALGRFCEKNGTAQFTESFVSVVKILADKKVFAQIVPVIINVPISRTTNMQTKEARLKRLTTAIFHLATEILVMMPAFGCHCLGQNFFADLISLKFMPSVQNLNASDAFAVFENGIPLLESAWKQNIPQKKEDDECPGRAVQECLEEEPPDDFRALSVMPNWEDICLDVEPFLRPNIVVGRYPNVGTYLDIHFRLLREDFFKPLRIGMLAYKSQSNRKNSQRPDNIRLYHQVKILEYDMNRDSYTLQFSTKSFKKIKWENTKRFLIGSLLLLSSDNFTSFFLFTVTERNPLQLTDGKIKAKFEGRKLPERMRKQTYIMAESTVFFECYRSVLTALQRISPTNFPLEDYVLGRKNTPEKPKYLTTEEAAVYDLSCIPEALLDYVADINTDKKDEEDSADSDSDVDPNERQLTQLQQVSIFDPSNRPDGEELKLDPSQCAALYAALTQKVSVIQGPPGTGKTYLGLRIVQTLLQNDKFWIDKEFSEKSPILVVCYTNHALDQFLEGILKFTRRIVRIGGQSKCPVLEPYSLMARKKNPRYYVQTDTKRWLFEIHEKLRELVRKREEIHSAVVLMDSCGILHHDSLMKMGIIPVTIHKKFNALAKSMRGYPDDWTAIGFWLQVYSNQSLEQVAHYFNTNGTAKQQAKVNSIQIAESNTNEIAEEEWDKEDIDEIQANRKIEEEDNILAFLESTARTTIDEAEDVLCERTKITFALKFSAIQKEIKNWTDSLETLEGEDKEWVRRKVIELQKNLMLLRQLFEIVPMFDKQQLEEWHKRDLMDIPLLQRWMMYITWRRKGFDVQEKLANKIEEQYREQANRLSDVRTKESAEICEKASVVGFTTTGAAKNRALLNHLKPKIVIVEEAAEVLEAHVISALSTACEQLILIGDHQQLRPSVAVHKLAKDYHLDVSLFERLIKNGMEPCVLRVQHRMRPEIAQLIVPSIYPSLENHASVLEYPHIRGMASDVFFLTHMEQELGDNEGKSHLNPYEAEISLTLARHLIMQGYDPSRITILTTYSGQRLHFTKIRRDHSAVQSVRISVVDDFQGEENDIIILSLVRSNEEENIGFLRIENRICVALSRAKHGFYMIGNMQNLQGRSKLWNRIREILNSKGLFGPDFRLKCDIHGVETKARKVTDFPPEGGCMEKCALRMNCGHTCPKICHTSDRDHLLIECQEKCTRLCPVGHPCPKKCFKDCHPCMESVTKTLPCTHEQDVWCFKDPAQVFCKTVVWKILPTCGHGMDLCCGASPTEAVCPELCGMTLDCGHICPLPCHKKSSHSKIVCEQPCRRSCENDHLCNKKCHEDCDQCFSIMNKTLPCGHEDQVECFKQPRDVFCRMKVEKVLPNCEHLIETECGNSTEGIKCKKPCEKLLCGDGHPCKKRCFEPCGHCFVRMEREFPCGHKRVMECYVDPLKIKCPVPKESDLPGCGHRAVIKCGQDPAKARCTLPCDVRLYCGHTCTLNCHTQFDPEHEEYICKKQCGRMKQGCKMEHKCGKKCFEECDPCKEKWKRTLPCGHQVFTECYLNDEDIFCPQMMTKTIAECGHKVDLACSVEPTRALCIEACSSVLSCGHLCKKKCCEPCDSADCNELVTTPHVNVCGHKVTLSCKTYKGETLTEHDLELHLRNCRESCGGLLNCSHLCKGTCGQCFNGRVHIACNEDCGRSLVCGHNCNVSCGSSCPPCRRQCEYFCVHSKCRQKCCEPCSPCQEKCQWSCDHKTCTKKCGERCNRTRCDEPCKKVLQCGHPCVGLCGELCPPLCRVCDKDKLAEFMLLGNEEDEDAKFIYLPDCGHCIEMEGMDNWMTTEGDGQIQPKRCPRCKTSIRNCMRYGDIIKGTFEDIAKAKQIILHKRGNPLEFFQKTAEQLSKCESRLQRQSNLSVFKNTVVNAINLNLIEIGTLLTPKKNSRGKKINPSLGTDQRYQTLVHLDFMERTLEMIEKVRLLRPPPSANIKTTESAQLTTDLANELGDMILKLFRTLMYRDRISDKEYEAVTRELFRLEYVRAFFVLKSTPQYPAIGMNSPEKEAIDRLLMKNIRVLEEADKLQIKASLETLAKKLRTGLGISHKERQEIVAAMGMSQGHWFKCPNGHIYAITECGGAMEESKCSECLAPIGGSQHRLRRDNALAGEMDGATRPAYPQ